MRALRDIGTLLRWPDFFLRQHLATPPAPRELALGFVLPLAALQPGAVLIRSLMAGTPIVAVVLAIGSLALQLGTWWALALVLPTLVRQAGSSIDDHKAYAVASYALVPSWLAGLLHLVPVDASIIFFWSRLLFLVVSLSGLLIAHRSVMVLDLAPKTRVPVVAGLAIAGLTTYLLLFVVLGVSSHIVLYLFGARAG